MTQRAITILALVPQEKRAAAAERIEAIGSPDIVADGLHYLSSSVIDDRAVPGRILSYVVLELNIDGRPRSFLERFAAENADFLDGLFTDCEGYDPRSRHGFLMRKRWRHITYHRGTPGRTVEQIREEERLLADVKDIAGRIRPEQWNRSRLWCGIQKNLSEPQRQFIKAAPKRPRRVRWNLFRTAVLARLGLSLTLLAQLLFYLIGLGLAVLYAREYWQMGLVVVLPVLVILTRTVLDLHESPHHLKPGARLAVVIRIFGRSVGGGLAVAALMGLLVGAESLGAGEIWPGVAWALIVITGGLISVSLLVVGYLAAGWPGFLVGLVGAGTLIAYSASTSVGHNGLLLNLIGNLALVAGAILSAILVLLFRLRYLEALDEVRDNDVPLEHLARVMSKEESNHNHLTSVTAIKQEWPRLWVLQIVLRTIHLGSYFIYNEGFLAGIPAIHFARFVILPGRRSLLFLSNYDGSFDGYLTQFKDSSGVTAVWGNTIGFPRSFLLLFDGAKDEHRFKRYARNSQVATQVWYRAYPELNVDQIDNGSQIRRDLNREVFVGRHGYWMSVKNLLTRRMNESDLADSLRRIG